MKLKQKMPNFSFQQLKSYLRLEVRLISKRYLVMKLPLKQNNLN